MSNVKISELTEDTSPSTDDLVVTVDDPGGTPASKKTTIANLLGVALTAIRAVTAAANKIPYFTSSSAAAVLDVAEQTLVGRITGGNIAALTATQVRTLINVENGADVTDAANVNAAGAVMEADFNANTILAATTDDTPIPVPIGEQQVVGRLTGENIKGLSQAELATLVGTTTTATEAENEIEDLSYLPPVTTIWDPGNLTDGAGETSADIAYPGVTLGGIFIEVIAPYDLQGILCHGYVKATGTVNIRLQNETGGAIDLSSGTWALQARRI